LVSYKINHAKKKQQLNNAFIDPFADVDEDRTQQANKNIRKYIHTTKANSSIKQQLDLRIQQRNGRKTLTTLQGLPKEYDSKKILKSFKKVFACNGTIVEDDELGEVLQLSGDQRIKIAEFLVNEKIAKKVDIKIHGF
jgi:translation initiation factor 1